MISVRNRTDLAQALFHKKEAVRLVQGVLDRAEKVEAIEEGETVDEVTADDEAMTQAAADSTTELPTEQR